MALPLLAIAAAGAVVGAYSKFKQSQEQTDTLQFNRAIMEQNERVNQASIAFDKQRAKRESERFLSMQTAAVGKSGVAIGTGSALDIMLDSIKEIELDLFTYDLEAMKSKFSSESGIANVNQQLATTRKALPVQMLTSVIQGATSIASVAGGKA